MKPSAYPHLSIREEWLELVQEEVLEPDLPIIDPHHHLWGGGNRHGSRPYLLDELLGDVATGHKVHATVYLQAGWNLGTEGPPAFRSVSETASVSGVADVAAARNEPVRVCAGIVAYADLRLEELDAVLDAHIEAGKGRFRGIRQIAALDNAIVPTNTVTPPPGLLKDPAFQKGLRRLGERGLTFDAWLYHPQLLDLLSAAQAAPQTSIVINHFGGPLRCGPFRERSEDSYKQWLHGMRALSKCPNVYVKLGGFGMPVSGFDYHELPQPPSSSKLAADWKPWIEPCIELFAAEHCMFESNFPVDKAMFSYLVVWNAFKRLSAGASKPEQHALLYGTASRVYKL